VACYRVTFIFNFFTSLVWVPWRNLQWVHSIKTCKKQHNILKYCSNKMFKCSFSFFLFFSFGTTAPQWARASSSTRFLDHTQRRTTVGRASLDEWSARRRDLYLTTHNNNNRQTSMRRVGFEPTISVVERPLTDV